MGMKLICVFAAWDQSSRFVKFYVSLLKVHTLEPNNIYCNFTKNSFALHVKNLENKHYTLNINKLLKDIDPEQSSWKIKTGTFFFCFSKEIFIFFARRYDCCYGC